MGPPWGGKGMPGQRQVWVLGADGAWSPLAEGLSHPVRAEGSGVAGLQGNKSSNIPGASLLSQVQAEWTWVSHFWAGWKRVYIWLSFSRISGKAFNHLDPRFPLLSNGTNSSYFVGLLGEVKETGGVWQVPNSYTVGGSIFIFILDASDRWIYLTMRMP